MRTRTAIAALVMLLLTSCRAFDDSVGASSGAGGRGLVIHYVACTGESVSRVVLRHMKSDRLSASARILWAIRATRESVLSSFTVGERPLGFREPVPLGESVPRRNLVAGVYTGTDRARSSLYFDLEQLHSGAILSERGPIGSPEFLANGVDDCRPPAARQRLFELATVGAVTILLVPLALTGLLVRSITRLRCSRRARRAANC